MYFHNAIMLPLCVTMNYFDNYMNKIRKGETQQADNNTAYLEIQK